MKRLDLKDRVVVVMGASSGIGRLTALEFARRGARVVVAARSDEPLETLVQEITAAGGQGLALPADTADYDQVRAVAEEAVHTFGRLDIWVQMAAIAVYARFEETTPDEFRDVISVDLVGQAYGAMAALPIMKRQGRGHLIHVASVESEVPIPYHAAYNAAKHGVAGMLNVLRLELQESRAPVFVTTVMPASIDTPFFDHARTKLGVKPQGLPPIYDPQDVARGILEVAQRPRREIIVGGAGRWMVRLHRHFPRLTEALVARTALVARRPGSPGRRGLRITSPGRCRTGGSGGPIRCACNAGGACSAPGPSPRWPWRWRAWGAAGSGVAPWPDWFGRRPSESGGAPDVPICPALVPSPPTPPDEVNDMAVQGELRVFLRRTTEGAYRLQSEDGMLVLQSDTYRELRAELARMIGASALPCRVKILLGAPQGIAAPLRDDPIRGSELRS
jgi:NAD(P)-dependent dehydrogenase (short-subunit alcohol dehydrogenase family)